VSSYIGGVSSGFISAVALNAILENAERGFKDGFSWNEYKSLVFNLTTGEVYDDSWEGIAKILTYNIFEGYFLDNTPLEKYLAPYLEKMNYLTFGDLYLPTAVTLVNQSSGDSVRYWSNDPQYADIPLLELLMATTALPLAFPPRQVPQLGNTTWIDGGTGIDTIPVYAPLHNPNVSELYILCYGSALTSGGAQLPSFLNDILLLKNSIATINDMRVDLYNGAIDIAQRSNITSYTYIPHIPVTYSALDFDDEKAEYLMTANWTKHNNPTQLNKSNSNPTSIDSVFGIGSHS